jgi:hypothetical protein
VSAVLQLFFPQFFDSDSPHYVPEEILEQLVLLAETSRPPCLNENEQDFAQAYFTAYLVSLRKDTSSGTVTTPVAGPIVSEKEGDIAITYAAPSSGVKVTQSERPPSDPWDVWKRFWDRCTRGAILTRFGDPVNSAQAFTSHIEPIALNVWRQIW